MKKRYTYTKISFAALFMLAVQITFGAFTGNVDEHKDKFSLKNLNSSNKVYSFPSLRTTTFRYSGSLGINQKNSGNQLHVQSLIRLERGNTTYVYPYKYVVKVPRFVTPSPVNSH